MYQAIVFMPLVGFLLAGLFSKSLGSKACEYITTALMIASASLSWLAFISFALFSEAAVVSVPVAQWISVGDINANWALRIDTLSVVMLATVTSISALVHLFSIGFMRQDPNRPRFFGYLSLSTFSMLMLVTADNLLQIIFGWQMIALSTYLLVGFWYQKPQATRAAIQVFIVNRIGDLGLLLGVFSVFVLFNTIELQTIFTNTQGVATSEASVISFLGNGLDAGGSITLICILLLVAAAAKSAQFLLHIWVSETIEGPVPASALIYAATLLPAGAFLIARMSPLFEFSATALSATLIWGAITAVFAGATGLVQTNIRRAAAYAVCCNMGIVFVALGAGAYGAALFHVFASAFIAALFFFAAGSVIHALNEESDMRRMGGLKKNMPLTYWSMVVGGIAIAGIGVPGTALGTTSFGAQNSIFASLFVSNTSSSMTGLTVLLFAVFLCSLFVWRMIFMTFHGQIRSYDDVEDHIHEPPGTMRLPLYVLAAAILFLGFLLHPYFVGFEAGGDNENWYSSFWREAFVTTAQNNVLVEFKNAPMWVFSAPVISGLLGFLFAWFLYARNSGIAAEIAKQHSGLHQFLLNRWYFSELYTILFVRPVSWLGRLFAEKGDDWLIDGYGPSWLSERLVALTSRATKTQSGSVHNYAFAMVVGVVAVVSWTIFMGGE